MLVFIVVVAVSLLVALSTLLLVALCRAAAAGDRQLREKQTNLTDMRTWREVHR